MEIGKDTSGQNPSSWFEGITRPDFPQLTQNLTTNVCIIGAGISGLTTAYRLICEGKSVVVLDDGKIGSGETGRTTAHLTNILDDRYFEIERVHGERTAHLAANSHAAAIQFIEETVQNEKIDCDFSRVSGYLFLDKDTPLSVLKNEFEATKKLGLGPQFLDSPPNKTFNMGTSIEFPNQAQFHPMKYLEQLAKVIIDKGGKIFEMTRATHFEKGKPIHVSTNTNASITADYLVIATNVPINDRIIIHTKQEPNRTYAMSFLIPKDSLHSALYWDTGNPYHYVRIQSGNYEYNNQACDLLITGGEDHRTGKPPFPYQECFNRLEKWSREFFPQILKKVDHWSGQIMEPVDYLAFIGHNPLDSDNCFIVTGDSGNGITHGTLAALLISDLILNKTNEWTSVYKPSRKSFLTLKNYLHDNLLTALSYLQLFTPGEVSNTDYIQVGEGKIIRKGLSKVAAYRDKNGKLHECSALCPHLKSIVNWNSAEKTWDCPAHGSRFTGEGDVINGPALCPLNKVNQE